MHFYVASLENPADFKPSFHVTRQSKLPWFQLTDDLQDFATHLVAQTAISGNVARFKNSSMVRTLVSVSVM